MTSKHLSTGSPDPPLVPGKLRLYSMRFCPYAQRAQLVLDVKKIPYDVVWVNLTKKPEWLAQKNPLSKVPVLQLEEGSILYESLIVSDFLDEAFPETPLYPSDPLLKAKDKLLVERFNSVILPFFKIVFSSTVQPEESAAILDGLEIFEKELEKRGKPFFGGNRPGMLDLMIWPWFERFELLGIMSDEKFVIPRGRFLRLDKWEDDMKVDDGVRVSFLDVDKHAKYVQTRKATGTPAYDSILES
ncbi:pyrimidodiazepine synthase-like [Athalia rosae]|uniref:pyrimidodiazepine synthase-like n=1 Tax=Athalia rosae TaxID=37344 RepID=UPI0020344F97|nr:pyrimidodiazepine synthase-like [Athalia rosae]